MHFIGERQKPARADPQLRLVLRYSRPRRRKTGSKRNQPPRVRFQIWNSNSNPDPLGRFDAFFLNGNSSQIASVFYGIFRVNCCCFVFFLYLISFGIAFSFGFLWNMFLR